MARCVNDLLPISATKIICIQDDSKKFCPWKGFEGLLSSMPASKLIGSTLGYLEECGQPFSGLQGGKTGVQETSSKGANSAVFAIVNLGSGKYVVDFSSKGSNYAEGDKIVIKGTILGGTTPTNDCTLTYDGSDFQATGTPKSIDVSTCTKSAMDTLCSTCATKANEAATTFLMGHFANDAKTYENWGKLNSVACMRVPEEGYCAQSLSGTIDALSSMSTKAEDNPYCSKTKLCPKKFIASYVGILSNFDPTSVSPALIMKMLGFSCITNPENGKYCVDLMKGTDAPWTTANCKKVPGLETDPFDGPDSSKYVAPAATKLSGTACATELVAFASSFGCCVSSISSDAMDQGQGKFIIDIFTNAGSKLKAKCDLMASNGTASLSFTGLTKTWLQQNEALLKADLCSSAGLPPSAIAKIEYAESTTRSLRFALSKVEAAMASMGELSATRDYFRRLGDTTTALTVTFGTQDTKQTTAASILLSSSFQPSIVKQKASVDGLTILNVTSSAKAVLVVKQVSIAFQITATTEPTDANKATLKTRISIALSVLESDIAGLTVTTTKTSRRRLLAYTWSVSFMVSTSKLSTEVKSTLADPNFDTGITGAKVDAASITAQTQSPAPAPAKSTDPILSTGAIIGIAVGGAVFIVILASVTIYYLMKTKANKDQGLSSKKFNAVL